MISEATVAVDVGGTFTDVTLVTKDGRLFSAKVPSDREFPEKAFAEGVAQVLERASVPATRLARSIHATTLVTNTVLEQKGPPVALLTTRGFRHVLEIGRHDGPRRSSMLTWSKPKRPVPPANVFEIDERMAADGSILRPLDEAGCRDVGRMLRNRGITSIAISFINAYASGGHEERAAQVIAEEHPDASVSLSSRVLPALREYERTLATALNAYVMPSVDRYLREVDQELARGGTTARSFVMQSNGGHLSSAEAQRRPIAMILSGPAASAIGAARLARRARLHRAISFDMGGTSTDVCVLHHGEPEFTDEAYVGPWPFALPSVDVHSIGAGGGSIARVAKDGSIRVGPDSAGSDPGPACYGTGGSMATVTDANLVLGRLPDQIAGGRIPLDRKAAQDAISTHVAGPLDIDVETAARGVIEVVNNNMVGAIRVLTTQRGRDPRDYVLIAVGGAGPLHAAEVGRLLGCSRIVIPPTPGVHSTIGLLESPLRRVFVSAHIELLRNCDPVVLEGVFERLEAQAQLWFEEEGVRQSARRTKRYASVHFLDQTGDILVEWAGASALETSLRQAHSHLFGYVPQNLPGEILGLRVVATAAAAASSGTVPTSVQATRSERRDMHPESHASDTVEAFERQSLKPGSTLHGPAVVEQMDSTTYVPSGFTCTVDRDNNLVLATARNAAS